MDKRKTGGQSVYKTLIPIIALVVALSLTVSASMLSNSESLDRLFGRGERTVVSMSGDGGELPEYYTQRYANTQESRKAAQLVAKTISDEGIVLLKNDGLLPLPRDTAVTPFGLRYAHPIYGGSGSSAIDSGEDYIITPSQGLAAAFPNLNREMEETLFHALGSAELSANANLAASRPMAGITGDYLTLYEFKSTVYSSASAACADTVGIVYIGRQTGENQDASASVYDDGGAHTLALSRAESDTIAYTKTVCDGVVVVVASSAPMELARLQEDDGISAILWVGGAGSTGYGSLGDILTGAVVPSGRVPDLYPVDFKKDPTFANHDDGSDRFLYQNAFTTLVEHYTWTDRANTPFREYEEGVYLGYKYYESAYDLGYLKDYYSKSNGVLYPFGYGLSYTEFEQSITGFSDFDDRIRVTVWVENKGHYPGKEVVQLYVRSPYTELDETMGIEKPTVQLLAFEKTKLLGPGEHQFITLEISKEDLASYCYTSKNPDGTVGCYLLEEGSYELTIRANSHDVLDSRTAKVYASIWYDNATPRQSEQDAQSVQGAAGLPLGYLPDGGQFRAATNQFDQLTSYMTEPGVSHATVLSRTDWLGSQPTAPTREDTIASDTVIAWVAQGDTTKFDYETDERLGNVPGSLIYHADPVSSGEDNGLVLADLRGKFYSDPLWNSLLDQVRYDNQEELRLALFEGGYSTGAIGAIGKPKTLEHDGPQGLTQPDVTGHNWLNGTCAYPSQPILAATWNQALMYEFGYMVGQEALLQGISGWYAPGLNIHRSPFSGRYSEHYSEDPVLTGLLGAEVLSGAGDAGLYCAVKHLALIDAEAHRNPHSAVWLTEQALREAYLRPFEIALKRASMTVRYQAEDTQALQWRVLPAGTFLMTADCGVGATWTAASYELLTGVVRGEWGFQGFIISDMAMGSNQNRIDMILRAGCDGLMSTSGGSRANAGDFSSPTGMAQLRRAIKNLCYMTVNSNSTQRVAPGSVVHVSLAPWRVLLITINAAAGAFALIATGWMVCRWRRKGR